MPLKRLVGNISNYLSLLNVIYFFKFRNLILSRSFFRPLSIQLIPRPLTAPWNDYSHSLCWTVESPVPSSISSPRLQIAIIRGVGRSPCTGPAPFPSLTAELEQGVTRGGDSWPNWNCDNAVLTCSPRNGILTIVVGGFYDGFESLKNSCNSVQLYYSF